MFRLICCFPNAMRKWTLVVQCCMVTSWQREVGMEREGQHRTEEPFPVVMGFRA